MGRRLRSVYLHPVFVLLIAAAFIGLTVNMIYREDPPMDITTGSHQEWRYRDLNNTQNLSDSSLSHLTKRVFLKGVNGVFAVRPYYTKGLWLDGLMRSTIADTTRRLGRDSQVKVTLQNLHDSGWVRMDDRVDGPGFSIAAFAPAFADSPQLSGPNQGQPLSPVQVRNGPNKCILWTQTCSYKVGNTRMEPTLGHYWNTYNQAQGVIVMLAAWGPKVMSGMKAVNVNPLPGAKLPTIHHWSDITWVEWSRQHTMPGRDGRDVPVGPTVTSTKGRDRLYYIFINDIRQPTQIAAIVAECLKERRQDYAEAVPEWPGETYALGHWCFLALLGSEVGAGPAWLLITHKFGVGVKALTKVTIFWAGHGATPDEFTYPSLRWKVENNNAELITRFAQTVHDHPLQIG